MKSNTRKRVALIRDSLKTKDYIAFSKAIKKKLFSLKEYKKAKSVLFYFSFGSEVMTENMIKEALSEKTILLPQVIPEEKTIHACKVVNLKNDLAKGHVNIIEPKSHCEIFPKEQIDLIVVPGIAFGEKGERLGYGSGYYDRFLKGCNATFIGLAFEIQITDKIITEAHDVNLHKIITEKRIIDCRS